MNLGRDEKPVAAIATAPGAAGVAAIRISGAGAFGVLDRLIKPREYRAGTFFFARFHHPVTGEFIDSGVVLIFKAPASYTGEDTVELQCHGGARQPERLLRAVLAAGAEQAGPGEFTRRAFLNGRMDLTQAEAVADLIHAQSERAAKAAGLQLDGSLGREIGIVYDGLTDWCAAIEHALDFEEGELPASFHPGLLQTAAGLQAEILRIAGSFREGRLLREGALAVICGKPNTGKSSLFNALLGHRRAIVNAQAGTTRDSIEESLVVCGIPLRLTDTAGLRETACEIEHEGVVLAHRTIAAADLIIYLVDAATGPDREEQAFLATLAPEQLLLVYGKTDLTPAPEGAFGISLASDAGIRAAVSGLHRALERKLNLDKSAPVAAGVSQRHHQELIVAAEQLESARKLLADSPDFLVPAAEHAKNAAEAVGRILGRTYSEDLLERVFSRFCVGK